MKVNVNEKFDRRKAEKDCNVRQMKKPVAKIVSNANLIEQAKQS